MISHAAGTRVTLASVRGTHRTRWVAGTTAITIALVLTGFVNPVAVLAALGTGFFNTAAGGGAVITFLALTATGVPALITHATSQTVTPFSFLSALRLVKDYRPATRLLSTGCAGTLAGVAILKATPPGTFQVLAPFFLVPAAIFIVFQEPIKRRIRRTGRTLGPKTTLLLMFGCGVYAGLIGVGTGTLALVVLGLTPSFASTPLPDLLRIRNVLLLGMALLVAIAFAFTGLVNWSLAALLILPGATGGWIGTRLVTHLPVPALQALIALTAIAGATWMLLR
jgi:uncharacterized membrane protein YfcA